MASSCDVRIAVFIVVISATITAAWVAHPSIANSETGTKYEAASLYDRFCLNCHGAKGDGAGPAATVVWPLPRDFTRGEYKWRSTKLGSAPTDEDLRQTIRFGVPGTSMHAFDGILNEAQVDALTQYLKTFSPTSFSNESTTPAIRLPEANQRTKDPKRGKELFATLGCVQCHGASAKGDGPVSVHLKDTLGRPNAPYDLTKHPVRRPRHPEEDVTAAIYMSIATGLMGTPMPAFAHGASPSDLWAVASYIESIQPPVPTAQSSRKDTDIPSLSQKADQTSRFMKAGYYPGRGNPVAEGLFAGDILPQGSPPPSATPAQGSLSAKQCARCHAAQVRQWSPSLHARASSPGLIAQLIAMERSATTSSWANLQSCQRCHAPLAEQSPVLSAAQSQPLLGNTNAAYTQNPVYDQELRKEGLTCASCHVRNHKRYGPPKATDKKRLQLPGYPVTELTIFERSDFCMPCHQLPSRIALNDKPLLNTYKEWLEGPYMPRGVQCQHCHMPDREHTWKGVHDRDTFLQGIDLDVIAKRGKSGTVSVRARLTNVGAGHYLPTTPTPAAWLTVELVDDAGRAINGAKAQKRIGRHLVFDRGWKEIEDTRIPPGESEELAAAWKDGRVPQARTAVITVRVEPDEYYERFYLRRLQNKSLPAKEREMFLEALRKTRESQYIALVRRVALNH